MIVPRRSLHRLEATSWSNATILGPDHDRREQTPAPRSPSEHEVSGHPRPAGGRHERQPRGTGFMHAPCARACSGRSTPRSGRDAMRWPSGGV